MPEPDVVEHVWSLARATVPEAVDGESYGIPALRYRGRPLLGVRATKAHIGLYPFSPEVVAAVAGELEARSVSKGTIRFTAVRPLSDDLVRRVVLLRRDEIDAALGDR